MAYRLMLKELREASGMRQEDLAAKLGVKLSTYRTWEQGVTGIKMERAFIICEALGCTPNDLCNWWEDHPRPTRPPAYTDERQRRMNSAYGLLDEDSKSTLSGLAETMTQDASRLAFKSGLRAGDGEAV